MASKKSKKIDTVKRLDKYMSKKPPKLFGRVKWEQRSWGWRIHIGKIYIHLLASCDEREGCYIIPLYNVRGGCPLAEGSRKSKKAAVRWLEQKFTNQLVAMIKESGLADKNSLANELAYELST